MPPVSLDRLIGCLREYVRETGTVVDLLLVGGLALQAFGYPDRATQDLGAEMSGDPEALASSLCAGLKAG